jgi:hypothetical protein
MAMKIAMSLLSFTYWSAKFTLLAWFVLATFTAITN